MRNFRDAKLMAKSLRAALAAKSITVSHSDSLELLAQAFGVDDWNILAAKIAAAPPASDHALPLVTQRAGEPPGANEASNTILLSPAIPLIRIFDVAKAKDFYLGRLGFTLAWEHRYDETFPLYAQISRSAVTLHLTEHAGDCTPGSTVYINMHGLDEFQREVQAKGSRASITAQPGNREVLELHDPFGNRLRFSQTKRDAHNHARDGYSKA